MKKIALTLFVIALASPLAAETWKGVALMDASCAAKKDVMAHPENHKKGCALQCSKSGYGAIVDGKFVKFDKKGDELAVEALKKSDKKDHLTANVTGELKDGTIEVSALTLE
ncbi:MAG TPA: hypothetical protein VLV78_11190 [Thermoanaerobaculia bacterium]|nr:hypothetical protein [Thermoanaerobaculia bacterium]